MIASTIEKNELLELEILNHIEDTQKLTTRLIASHLGCNLRLTHALLKKLISKGLLDVKKINSRNWQYFLTPAGITAKANKTYKFFEFSMKFYQQARERSSSLCVELMNDAKLDVAFFGCGQLAEIAYLSVRESNLKLIEVYGDNRSNFLGHPVLPFTKLSATKADAIIICIYDKQRPAIQFLDKMKPPMVKWIF
jgi:predicted transcriptional regulator